VRSRAKAGSVLVFLTLLFAVMAPSASAATTAYSYLTSFGSGQVGGTFYGNWIGNSSVAVEEDTGNIVVPNSGEIRIFAPDPVAGGTSLTTFPTVEMWPTGVAVDQDTGTVYAQASEGLSFINYIGRIERFTSDGAPTPTYTYDPAYAPEPSPGGDTSYKKGIAFDPTTGELLAVAYGASEVERLDPTTGALDSSFDIRDSTQTIAVGPDGTVYVGSEGNGILRYDPSGTELSSFPSERVTALAVDSATGDVYAATNGPSGPQLIAYSATGEKLSRVPLKSLSYGIAIDPSRERLYSFNGGGSFAVGEIEVYAPAPYPEVEVPTVSDITTTSFHVETEVDPGEKEGGGLPDESSVHFEYRLKGEASWSPTPDQDVTAAGPYEADITGLESNRTYEVRAVASNSLLTNAGDSAEATTMAVVPATETGPATDVSETSAVLNGTINPGGLQTTYYFEYGTTPAYGSRIPAGIEAVAGGGYSVKPFFRTLTGLTPGTTYHYRLVATNSVGTAEGADRTFTTIAAGGIAPRAYEQVSAPDKHGDPVIPRIGFQASADGNGVSFLEKAGANASPITARGLALRGTSDWQGDISLDPPINTGTGNFLVHPALAISDDFTHAFVASNRALTPGAIEEGGNVYRLDIASGTYEFIGGSKDPGTFDSFAGSVTAGTYRAGAPDFSWIIFVSENPLLPGAPKSALYRWSESDGLEVVSVTPNGDMTSSIRPNVSPVYETVSADGSRIYYSAVDAAEPGVYLREDGGDPKPVSVSAGDPTTPQPAILLAVNEDGRYAYISTGTGVKLTDDAPGEEGDLYRYDLTDDSLEYLGEKAYVDVNGENQRISYGSMGVSADGSTLYFNSGWNSGNPGLGPLMVWRDGAIHQAFSGSISAGSERLSPNGRYYVTKGTSGEIEIYDAEANQVSCVSCLPDGTPVSATLPEGTEGDLMFSNRSLRSVADDGTVYFDTTARLVAADVNGTRDVYAWRDGTATLISPGNRSFDAIIGDVSASGNDIFFTTQQKLVGRDNDEAIDVYDARVNGGLPAQSPPPPQECLRDDCKATPNAGPELPFGGSEALSGPGNVNPPKHKKCGKGKRAKKVNGKVRCVKKHKANKSKKGGNR
jgi:hypothetical protein